MGIAAPTPDELRRRLSALKLHGGNQQRAADALGISRTTLQHSIKIAKRDGIAVDDEPDPVDEIILPEFPDDDISVESIIDHLASRNRKRRESYAAHTWFPIKVKERRPIGLLLVGDPHLDDSGCDWDTLRSHIAVCKDTPGIYGVNIGDSTNCWGGRLIRKYADQETSLKTARRLVEWFLLDSGIHWLIWLYGNHEQMGDGSAILGQMAKRFGTRKVAMHDWEARFSIQFADAPPIKIWTAHDFAGHSMWNPLHGPVKAARFGNDIDLLVAGHKHNWAIAQWEMAEQGTSPLMVRVKGYKTNDDFARRLGIVEQQNGASVLAVLNPNARSRAGRVIPFVDVEEGADYLSWLRKKP